MAEWWSIEVFHADLSARRWKDSYEDALTEAAVANGALNWAWHEHRTGVVLELEFRDEAAWEAYRSLPAVRAALDAAPDPVNGLLIYRGRGGAAGSRWPRRRGPKPSAGAMARPEPAEEKVLDLTEATPPGL
jgi:quinol monooxygenase YgiN